MSDYLLFGPIIALILGMLIGSFLNCLAWRLYKEETILGRSYCPKCLKPIKWFDNIPLISFFLLKGRCRACSQKISWQYPLVELVTGLLFYLAFLTFGSDMVFLIKSLILIATLILVFIFDFRWYLIPVSALIWSGILIFLLGSSAYAFGFGYYLFLVIINMMVAGLFFGLQYLLTRGRGLGEGDIWLGVFIGLSLLTLKSLGVAILIAYFGGALVGGILLIFGHKKWSSKLPLGVFLVIGALISLFWGNEIMTWYLGLFSL